MYCYFSGVGGLLKKFNIGHIFFTIQAIYLNEHKTLVHHQKGYNLTKEYFSVRLFDKMIMLYDLGKIREKLNLGCNLLTVQVNLINLYTLVYHHKGYNLSEGHNSVLTK